MYLNVTFDSLNHANTVVVRVSFVEMLPFYGLALLFYMLVSTSS